MAPRKKTTPEIKTPETTKTPVKKPTHSNYLAVYNRLWHPDQNSFVETSVPKEFKYDSWIDSQEKAGLIKKV